MVLVKAYVVIFLFIISGVSFITASFNALAAISSGNIIQNVVWNSTINAAVAGNSIQKISGCDGCADAGAVSSQSIISGDGYVEFVATETNTQRSAGLSNDNTDTSLSDIDFAIHFNGAGIADVRENGIYKADTNQADGDIFRVAVVNSTIKYSKNGVVFYTSIKAPVYPLLVDTSLWSIGATIKNATISGTLSGTDTILPVRNNSQPTGTLAAGTTSAILSLTTNENATCKYATTSGGAYTNMTNTFSTTDGIKHTVAVAGLIDGNTYNYYVKCIDSAGNFNTDDFIISFSIELDTVPPVVSLDPLTVSGTISISSNASDNVRVVGVQLELDGTNLGVEDITSPYSTLWDTTTATNGLHTLTAMARDARGNNATSLEIKLIVSNPFAISAVSVLSVNSSNATITWKTNEASDSQIEYGITTAYGNSTPLDTSLVKLHSVTIKELQPSATYHYRVKSENAAGDIAVSGDFNFTTLAASDLRLIGYWKFDEGSDTTADDSSGNANTGKLIDGPSWVTGKINQALLFDGVDDYVNVSHVSTLNAYPLTVTAWFKTNSTTGVRGIVNKYAAGSFNGYQIFINNGNLCAWYIGDASNYVYDGGGCTFSTPGFNDSQWHHVAFVVDASGGKFYIDGVQKGTQPWTGTPGAPTTTQALHIGHYPGAFGGDEYFHGYLDEVRIYNRTLNDTEIKDLASIPPSLPPLSDTIPPVISAVAAASTTSSGVIITWTTDEVSDTQVAYGLTTDYGSLSLLNTTLMTAHLQTLSGLSAATTYHYRVKSKDAAGNLAVSTDFTFTTVALTTSLCGLTDSFVYIPPNYTTFVPPLKGETYKDPVFGCTIKRLSDAVAEGNTYVIHLYSSVNPFNANDSYVLLERSGGIMHIRDLNGNIIRDNLHTFGILPTSDPMWSPTDPNILYFHPVGGNTLKMYNVTANAATTLFTFPYVSVKFGQGEGDISFDGDHIPVLGDNVFGSVFTISTKSMTSVVDLLLHSGGVATDNIDVTPSNSFYTMFTPVSLGYGLELWGKDMNYKYKITDFQTHADRGTDTDGTDIVVYTNSADPTPLAGCPNGQIKLRLGATLGAEQCLQPLDWSLATHTSCNNYGQGWCLVSTYSSNNPATKWPAYTNELLQVKFDGSPTVRLAHTRSSNSAYERISRAAVSRSGKYILFDSDMQGSAVDVYLLFIPGAVA